VSGRTVSISGISDSASALPETLLSYESIALRSPDHVVPSSMVRFAPDSVTPVRVPVSPRRELVGPCQICYPWPACAIGAALIRSIEPAIPPM
jgi:hypothetical protein